jgi:Family of unknown function (DUF6603)
VTTQLDRYLLDQAARLAQPLQAAGASPDAALRLAAALGWDLGAIAGVPTDQLASAVSAAAAAFSNVEQTVEQGPADLPALAATLLSCATAFADLRKVVQGWTTTDASLPANLLETFADDLFAYLFDVYLSSQLPRLRAILQVAGVYQTAPAPAITRGDGRVVRRAQARPAWKLDLLIKALTDPPGLVRQLYTTVGSSPQAPAAIADLVGPLLAEALTELGIPAYYGTPGASSDSNLTTDEQGAAQHLLHVRVQVSADPQAAATAILDVTLGLTDVAGVLAVIVAAQGQLAATRTVGNWNLSASLTGQLQPFLVSAGAVTFEGTTAADQIQLSLSATRGPTGDGPMLRLGTPSGSRLEIGGLVLSLQLTVSSSGASMSAGVELQQALLAVAAGDGDSFLSSVLPANPVQLPIPLALGWSPGKGFVVRGADGLRIDLAPHHPWGPVNVSSLLLELKQSTGGPALETSVSGNLTLGPLSVRVDHLGVLLSVLTSASGGSFGQLDVRAGFKLPDGLGLGLQAPPVSGVGFLQFDAADARYLGAIALVVGDVSISAVGVLDTKLPGGRTGYSLIVVASAQFPPIQLGFGFSLSAIGGLVGVNRTADVPTLQALARAGRLDDLMFPADLIHRAPQVAANLAQQFPVAQGHFIVGPAVQIQWGTGGLVYADIGVFIELTDSGGGVTVLRIALLGLVHLTLPDGAAPVADITLDVLGVLDFAAKTLSLDAGLRNSTIATYPLTGQAALRAGWGSNPEFLFAIGGFNPCFQAPAGFPALQRIALSIGGDNPRLRLSAYLALTSNTLQLGCAADLYASTQAAGVTAAVAASLTFDALVQFKPFGLIVGLTISAAILINNNPILALNLDLHVTGPDPWTVTGSASFQFLFTTITVPITIGGPAAAPPPATRVDLDGNLLAALADPRSWATGPPAGRGLVRVRSQGTAGTAVHPLGSLTVRQSAVPLGQRIERYGPDLLDAPCRYEITGTELGAQPVTGTAVLDYFAPAQFRTMNDQDKLSSPSFESMTAGAALGAAGLSLAPIPAPDQAPPPPVVDTVVTPVNWDTLVLDSPDPAPSAAAQATTPAGPPPLVTTTPSPVSVPDQLLAAQLGGAAAARSGPAGQPEAIYASPGIGIAVQDPYYAITGLDLGVPASADLPTLTAGLTAAAQAGYKQNWQIVYTSEVG